MEISVVLIFTLEKLLEIFVDFKIILTGSRGYVGTATKELLEKYGYDVIEIDKKINKDTRYLYKYIKNKKSLFIIHLSAKKSIPESIKNPLSYYLNNFVSTLSVGIISRLFMIPVIFASSAAVYSPTNPYAKSKLFEEKILKILCKKLVILRYFNIVGKTKNAHDKNGSNVFSIINKNFNIKINSAESTRDYVHILDIAKANVLSVEYLKHNDILLTDIFTGNQFTMLDVVSEYEKNGVNIEYAVLNLPDLTIFPKIDNRNVLGWFPSYTFSDGVRSEIAFR
jgi:UDP-glucose 4-epimerase